MSLENTVEIEKQDQKKDKYVFLPSIVAAILFFSFFWIYSNSQTLVFLAGFIYASVIAIIGFVKLAMKHFKNGTSYIIPSVFFLTLLLMPSLQNFRNYVGEVRHKIRFSIEKKKYEAEVVEMKEAGVIYKEWKWGNFNGTNEYTLVYDGREETILRESMPTPVDSCARTLFKLQPHFYVVNDFCP